MASSWPYCSTSESEVEASSSEFSDTSSDSTKHYKRDRDSLKVRTDSRAASTMSLKLLIDPKSNRTLFAEEGKDFVDFLFLILALPVGTVAKLITKQRTKGCRGNLHHSIENLSDAYIHSKANINTILNCTANAPPVSRASPFQVGGYVKEAVTYMITDDLVVTPMSITSIITLLNKFNVKNVGVLQEKVIDVGKDKGQELLRALMQSRTVLTDVFLGKKVSE